MLKKLLFRITPKLKELLFYTVMFTSVALLLLGVPAKLSYLAALFVVSAIGLSGFFIAGFALVLAYFVFCIYWWFIRKTT